MRRRALSLFAVAMLRTASTAQAEDIRSLGVTVSPVGGYVAVFPPSPAPLGRRALTSAAAPPPVISNGYSAGVDWAFHNEHSWWFIGGHLSANALETEATVLSIRFCPLPDARVRPYLGAGASVLLPLSALAGASPDGGMLRVGPEVSAGWDLLLTEGWFLSAQGRYQDFPLDDNPFSGMRQKLLSAYLGVGVAL